MIRKNLNINKAARAIDASVKAGIYSSGYFMIGLPTETYEEASATVEFAIHSSLHIALFYITIPFAGTALAEMTAASLKDKNNIPDPKEMTYFTSFLNILAMSDCEMQSILQSTYRRFYLNPKRILKILIHHPNILNIPRDVLMTLVKVLPRIRNVA